MAASDAEEELTRCIGTLNKNVLARIQSFVGIVYGVFDHGQELIADGLVVRHLRIHIDHDTRKGPLQLSSQAAQPALKVLHIQQIAHAEAVAHDLGSVGRADALQGRADLVPAQLRLIVAIDALMEVEDNMSAVGEEDASLVVHAHVPQGLELAQHAAQVHHHTVADHALHSRMQDGRGNQVKLVLHAVHHDRVASIRATCHTRADVVVLGYDVNQLALAFVTPLGANHNIDRTFLCNERGVVRCELLEIGEACSE